MPRWIAYISNLGWNDMWDDLTTEQKANWKAFFARQGIYKESLVKKHYQEYQDYLSKMEQVAELNYKDWGYNNPDEAFVHALNDNTYDYQGFYRDNPNSNANALTHWPDTYKTVYHPTFSNESKYSGIVDRNYNPEGRVGGYWNNDDFVSADWQNKKLTGDYLKQGTNSSKLVSNPDIETLLQQKYWIEPVVDNTNIVQQQVFTPQEKSYAAALLAFYERHKSTEAEKKALQDANNAVKALKAAEFGTLDTPLSNDAQYAWRKFNNSKGTELLYPLPIVGEAMFGVDIADKLYSGNYSDAAKDLALYGAMTYAPEMQNFAKNIAFANAFRRNVNSTVLDGPIRFDTPLNSTHHIASANTPKQNLGSLRFFERKPSNISEAERLGIPKGERNNVGGIHPDSQYGNLRFIRIMDGLPPVDESGLVHLGKDDNLFTNFTTDLPFRLHGNYTYIPGPTYLSVSPRAFRGSRFYSIEPSDSFLSSIDSRVNPRYIRVITGDLAILDLALKLGMKTYTTDKLKEMFNYADRAINDEFNLGYVNKKLPFGMADVSARDIAVRHIDENPTYDYPGISFMHPEESAVNKYRKEIDRIFTEDFGRPTRLDYRRLEDMTGLSAGLKVEYDPHLIKFSTKWDPLATKDMFERVYYDASSPVEYNLTNKELHIAPYWSYDKLLLMDDWADYKKIRPLQYKKGGSIYIKHPGRLTALKKRTGKTEAELWATGNKDYRRMITFARNARKFKHLDGGYLDDIIVDPMGQWNHPGLPTRIPGNKNGTSITNYLVDNDLFVRSNKDEEMIIPAGAKGPFYFKGSYVDEYPLTYQFGGLFKKKQTPNYLYSTYGLNEYGQPRYIGSYSNPIFGYKPLSGINQSIGRDYNMPDYRATTITSYPIYMNGDNDIRKRKISNASDFFWAMENPNNVGLNSDGTYSTFMDPNKRDLDVGPGLVVGKSIKKKKSYTKDELDQAAYNYYLESMDKVRPLYDKKYGSGEFNKLDDSSKMVLMDVMYRVGQNGVNPDKWPKLFLAMHDGDISGMLSEARTSFTNDKGLNYDNARILRLGEYLYPEMFDYQYKDSLDPNLKIIKRQYGGLLKPFSYSRIPEVRFDDGGYAYIK